MVLSRLFLSIILLVTFLVPVQASAQNIILPKPGAKLDLSASFAPAVLKGITVHKENPFFFDFILDHGQSPSLQPGKANEAFLRQEGQKLVKYFLAALTIPEKDLWVNLSPYEKDRIVPDALGQTDMGRDMLAQDYILKQLTASLFHPDNNFGKEFWSKIYTQVQAKNNSTQIPVNTFHKVWIMADKAGVFERGQTALVAGFHLKVMLEEDYLAKTKSSPNVSVGDLKRPPTKAFGGDHSSSQIIRDIIIPALEQEVNEGQHFAPLRQIFHSLILASWYKNNLKQALINKVYSGQNKINGIAAASQEGAQDIYERYVSAYKKGVYNLIKEDHVGGQIVPRKYFSGGIDAAMALHPRTVSQFTDSGGPFSLLSVIMDRAQSADHWDNLERNNKIIEDALHFGRTLFNLSQRWQESFQDPEFRKVQAQFIYNRNIAANQFNSLLAQIRNDQSIARSFAQVSHALNNDDLDEDQKKKIVEGFLGFSDSVRGKFDKFWIKEMKDALSKKVHFDLVDASIIQDISHKLPKADLGTVLLLRTMYCKYTLTNKLKDSNDDYEHKLNLKKLDPANERQLSEQGLLSIIGFYAKRWAYFEKLTSVDRQKVIDGLIQRSPREFISRLDDNDGQKRFIVLLKNSIKTDEAMASDEPSKPAVLMPGRQQRMLGIEQQDHQLISAAKAKLMGDNTPARILGVLNQIAHFPSQIIGSNMGDQAYRTIVYRFDSQRERDIEVITDVFGLIIAHGLPVQSRTDEQASRFLIYVMEQADYGYFKRLIDQIRQEASLLQHPDGQFPDDRYMFNLLKNISPALAIQMIEKNIDARAKWSNNEKEKIALDIRQRKYRENMIRMGQAYIQGVYLGLDELKAEDLHQVEFYLFTLSDGQSIQVNKFAPATEFHGIIQRSLSRTGIKDFIEKTGIPDSSIRNYAKGISVPLKPEVIIKMADEFGLKADQRKVFFESWASKRSGYDPNKEAQGQSPQRKQAYDNYMASIDQALMATNELGGIDLQTSRMQWEVQKRGEGVEFHIAPGMIQRIEREGFDGLTPQVIKMTPMTSLSSYLGINPVP